MTTPDPMREQIQALIDSQFAIDPDDLQAILNKHSAALAAAPQPAPSYEDLLDKIDGLESDLDNAVETAINRGAVDWGRMNYPNHRALTGMPRAQIGELLDTKRRDRDALVEAICAGRTAWANDGDGESCPDEAIADALLAAGWRRADQAALDAAERRGMEIMRERAAQAAIDNQDCSPWEICDAIRALPIQGGDDAA